MKKFTFCAVIGTRYRFRSNHMQVFFKITAPIIWKNSRKLINDGVGLFNKAASFYYSALLKSLYHEYFQRHF